MSLRTHPLLARRGRVREDSGATPDGGGCGSGKTASGPKEHTGIAAGYRMTALCRLHAAIDDGSDVAELHAIRTFLAATPG